MWAFLMTTSAVVPGPCDCDQFISKESIKTTVARNELFILLLKTAQCTMPVNPPLGRIMAALWRIFSSEDSYLRDAAVRGTHSAELCCSKNCPFGEDSNIVGETRDSDP